MTPMTLTAEVRLDVPAEQEDGRPPFGQRVYLRLGEYEVACFKPECPSYSFMDHGTQSRDYLESQVAWFLAGKFEGDK